MSLEPATDGDLAAVMRIERTPGYELFVGSNTGEEHRAMMRSPGGRYFVWREDGEVAGFAILLKLDDPNRVVRAKRIAVATAGQGVGGAMVRAVMDWVFEQTEANRFELDVSMENPRAQRVYLREGFVTEGVVREVYRAPDGRYVSSMLMSILRREWAALPRRAAGPEKMS